MDAKLKKQIRDQFLSESGRNACVTITLGALLGSIFGLYLIFLMCAIYIGANLIEATHEKSESKKSKK